MLIRSQNGTKLIDMSSKTISVDKSGSTLPYKNGYDVKILYANSSVWLGEYDSKEKAFQVLDMIGEAHHYFESGFEMEVFQMPQNDNVNVSGVKYKENPTLTANEKLFLDLIKEEYTYIARDENGLLAIYPRKPEKKSTYWLLADNPKTARDLYTRTLDVSFDFIKWEDEEPWLIEDLKKLEVKDE